MDVVCVAMMKVWRGVALLAEVWERVDGEGACGGEGEEGGDGCGDHVCDAVLVGFHDCANLVRDRGPLVYDCVYCSCWEEIFAHPWRLLR